jgi:hypothetical protein
MDNQMKPFDKENKKIRAVMTPDGKGDLIYYDRDDKNLFGVKLENKKIRFYPSEALQEIEEEP